MTAQLNQNQYDALVGFCYNCGNGSQVIKEDDRLELTT
ncbi:glycoside hydrolase family protein [Paenibacillus sp. FSL R7-0312]